MAIVRMDGKEYQLVDSEDWTAGELAEAEQALGMVFDPDGSRGAAMAISYFVSIRRVDTETHRALLADACKRVKMADFAPEDDVSPPAEAAEGGLPSQDEPQTSGALLSAVLE